MNATSDEINRLLADPTRLKIYRSIIAAGGKAVTVADIAAEFDLHPNVARMHLEKMAASGLLESEIFKTSGGGRPGRRYTIGSVVTSQYPPRDYQLLASIALSALESGGKPEGVALRRGREEGKLAVEASGLPAEKANMEQKITNFRRLVDEQGLFANVTRLEKKKLEIEVFNCIFRELSPGQEIVCNLHHNLIRGISESFFGKVRVTGKSGIAKGEGSCHFLIRFLS